MTERVSSARKKAKPIPKNDPEPATPPWYYQQPCVEAAKVDATKKSNERAVKEELVDDGWDEQFFIDSDGHEHERGWLSE